MAEEKDEGEVQETSGNSSVEEGEKSDGLDSQISTIEDQLSKAQATLFELQKMRADLELEKKEKYKKAQLEKEIIEAEKVKEENQKLREELKEYQTEIASIKEVIGSLKDNLVKTAERLEHKVEKSIKSLDGFAETEHLTKEPHRVVHHRDKSQSSADSGNFFADHISKLHQPEEQKVADNKEAVVATDTSIETEDTAHKDDQNDSTKVAALPQEASATQSQVPSSNTGSPVENTVNESPKQAVEMPKVEQDDAPDPSFLAKFWGNQPPQITNNEAVGQENPNEASNATATSPEEANVVDDDFDEYELIRQELIALESDTVSKAADEKIDNNVQQPIAEQGPSKAEEQQKDQEKPLLKSLFSIFKKKRPAVNESTEEKAVVTEQQNITDPVMSQAQEPSVQSGQEQVMQETPIQSAPETQATIQVVPEAKQEVAETTVQSEAVVKDDKPIKNVKSIFKRKKPKIQKQSEDDNSRLGPTGKLAIGAAVFLLLVSGAVVSYKLKNAEALRQMYTSKAIESVSNGNANVLANQVPDEFSNLDPQSKYKEAYAEAPFEQTVWSNYSDPELGISIDYPKNTSYRLKPVASNNLWFLRRDGYLLKIEKIITDKSLEDIKSEIIKDVKYTVENVIVRDRPAIHLILEEDLPVKGNIYLSRYSDGVYKIWYKTFLPEEDVDDQKRVVQMLDTLNFISAE
ncbi:MAG: hypothetical protein BWY19_00278 [bacterium ADurb.Bin212]|nr:MAG: hypothetical protein BWY19_00278 [bacterium ADurb.Bin212]